VEAREQARIGDLTDVPAHGLQGDAEAIRQHLDGHAVQAPYFLDELELSGASIHRERI
jgi:hypothetical protein